MPSELVVARVVSWDPCAEKSGAETKQLVFRWEQCMVSSPTATLHSYPGLSAPWI